MSDLTTSIKEIFNERISSPFYGSLIVSWLLWNWKIPYVTFIVDQDKLGTMEVVKNGVASTELITNKIDYILYNCDSILHLTVFPLLSAIIIIWLLPWVTNKASEITDIWDKRRVDKRNEIQKKKLLSYEESLRITKEMLSKESEFAEVLKAKNEEIQTLQEQVKLLSKETEPANSESLSGALKEEYEELFMKKDFAENFERIVQLASNGWNLRKIDFDIVRIYLDTDILISTSQTGNYGLTNKGKQFLTEFLRRKKEGTIKLSQKRAPGITQ